MKLDFHHLDPKEKEFGISQISAHMSWDKILPEIEKCVLLCRGCHAIEHGEDIIRKFEENCKEKNKNWREN